MKHAMTESIRAELELECSCDDADLLAERKAICAPLSELNTRRTRCEMGCEMECQDLRAGAKLDRRETEYAPKSRAAKYAARADRRDTRVQELEAELPSLSQQISEAEAKERAIRESGPVREV